MFNVAAQDGLLYTKIVKNDNYYKATNLREYRMQMGLNVIVRINYIFVVEKLSRFS